MNKDQQFRDERIREKAQNIADGLRRMADEIDRDVDKTNLFEMVQDVQHVILWGIPNLHIDSLINDLNMFYEFKDK